MATGGGGGGGYRSWLSSPNDAGVKQMSPGRDSVTPDTEENVIDQAEDVIRNFIYERYQEDLQEESSAEEVETLGNTTPKIPELSHFTTNPMSQASQVGRQLARIGDDINRRYSDEFNEMISQLSITEDTAYEVFANVARKLFSEGINWGRITALLCLAYRIAMQVLKTDRIKKFGNFLKVIIDYVVRFIKEKIASWIAQQGGWGAALTYNLSVSPFTLTVIAGSCFFAICAAIYFAKKGG